MAGSAGRSGFAADGEWLRCQLHAHSTVSDGDLAPHALARQYAAAGFDVLAITDHWRLTTLDAPPPGLVLLPGAELTADLGAVGWTADLLVFGIHDIPLDPGGDRCNWIVNEEEHWEQRTFSSVEAGAAWAASQGGVSFVAHPYWSGADHTVLLDAPHLTGVEVFNGGCETEGGRGDSSVLWDLALQQGARPGGIATDDSHMPLFDIGLAWTWVRAAERSPEAVLEALHAGHYYGSNGPRILELGREPGRVTVRCTPAQAIHLTTSKENGASLQAGRAGRRCGRVLETDGAGLITAATIDVDPQVEYVRVRIVDGQGAQAWTNLV